MSPGRTPDAVRSVRTAVRRLLAGAPAAHTGSLAVACSGGADSLALAAATAHVTRRNGTPLTGLVIDHALQAGSSEVAERTRRQLVDLGYDHVRVVRVEVRGGGGMEAAARRARYAALAEHRPDNGLVLLGHTLDDQAETVLLGLGRGSGPRSIAGMCPLDPPWARPFLELPRETTEAACAALRLLPWHDPHNTDTRFTRVRLRIEALPLLDEVLHGGVRAALARTAQQLREDGDALDQRASGVRTTAESASALRVAELIGEHVAVRRRVLRSWLLDQGVPELSDAHLRSADELVADWRGQGEHALPGNFVLRRAHGRLLVEARGIPPAEWPRE